MLCTAIETKRNILIVPGAWMRALHFSPHEVSHVATPTAPTALLPVPAALTDGKPVPAEPTSVPNVTS